MTHLPPKSDRWFHECHLVGVNCGLLPYKIGVLGFDPCGLVDDLPNDEQPGNEELHGIVGEECGGVPRQVSRVSVDAGDSEHPGQSKVGAPGLEPASVWQLFSVETLGLTRLVKADVCYAHYDVVDQTWNSFVSGHLRSGEKGKVNLPPPVTRLANQVMATAEPLETAVKAKSGKIITTAKQ